MALMCSQSRCSTSMGMSRTFLTSRSILPTKFSRDVPPPRPPNSANPEIYKFWLAQVFRTRPDRLKEEKEKMKDLYDRGRWLGYWLACYCATGESEAVAGPGEVGAKSPGLSRETINS